MQRPQRFAAGAGRIGRVGPGAGARSILKNDRVDRRIEAIDARQKVLKQLAGAEFALAQAAHERCRRAKVQIGHGAPPLIGSRDRAAAH